MTYDSMHWTTDSLRVSESTLGSLDVFKCILNMELLCKKIS